MVLYHNWRHAFNVCQLMFAMLTVSVCVSVGGHLSSVQTPYPLLHISISLRNGPVVSSWQLTHGLLLAVDP